MKIKPENSKPAKNPEDRTAGPRKRPAQKKPKKITRDYLHNSGLHYLQRYSSSAANFESVMLRKIKKSCMAHPDQDHDACTELLRDLIEKFQRAGLLNDELYSEGMVTSLRRRGQSRQAIRQKLAAKGLESDLIDEKLEAHDGAIYETPADAEFSAAVKMARRKKLGPFAKDNRKTPENAMAAMGRAGFSYDVIKKVLGLGRDEAEEYLYRHK